MRNRRLTPNPAFWCGVALAAAIALPGCGSSHVLSAQDEDQARKAIEQGLSAWKKGEPATKWSGTTASIRFVDGDWMASYQLMSYQIVRISAGAQGAAEAIVKLSVKPKKGAVLEREALYTIHKKENQVIVSRDPMY